MRCQAIFHSAEIGFSTLEALVICKFEHCPSLKVIVILIITWIYYTGVLVNIFELCTLDGLFSDVFLDFQEFLHVIFNYFTVRCMNLSFARRTVKEAKLDTRGRPPLSHDMMDTLYMEHVLARELD